MKKHGFYWHELRDFIFTQDDKKIAVSFTAYQHSRRNKFLTHFLNHKFKRTWAKGTLNMRIASYMDNDEQILVTRRTNGSYQPSTGMHTRGSLTEEYRCMCFSDVLARVIQHISNANYIAKKIPYKTLKRIILLSEKEVFMEKNELDTV